MARNEGFKYWSDQEFVQGFDANAYLMSQSVMRFDNSTDRSVSLARSLVEGMLSYDKSTTSLQLYDGTAWQTIGVVGVTDHSTLVGLSDDDHTQYFNETRGDARYYTQTQIDARYYTQTQIDALFAGLSTDHGDLTGLASDDHTQYHNDTRGDARYLQLSGGSLSGDLQIPDNYLGVGRGNAGTYRVDIGNEGVDGNILRLKGADDQLLFTVSAGDWSILNSQQSNGIVIYDGTGGVEVWYNGASYMDFDNGGIVARTTLNMNGNSITASGGISGLDLSNGISGNNFNITGVNQIEINDPGEGIAWTGGASGTKTLYVIDDSTDDVLHWNGSKFSATTYSLNGLTLSRADSDGSMRVQGSGGYIDIGPKNTSYCHIYTDRGSFYFNKSTLYANGTGNIIWHGGNSNKDGVDWTCEVLRHNECRGDNGSASDPSYTFNSDQDTGMYRNTTNSIGFTTGNARRTVIHSDGHMYHYYQHLVPNMSATGSYNTVRWNTSNGHLMRYSSTIDIKEDVVSLAPVLEYLNERSFLHDLRPVLYHEKDQADGTNNTRGEYLASMVAEEVLEVAPELCYYDRDGKLTSFGLEALIPHIVAELQRLSPLVEELYGNANPDWVAPTPRPAERAVAERELYEEAAAAQALVGLPDLSDSTEEEE